MVGAIDWERVIDALVRVEEIDPEQSGLLSCGSSSIGGIFVEKGRICWVAAAGLQRRLKDLLVTSTRAGADLDRIYERCRTEGTLLGETLVEEGWITPTELESALRRHSAESLVELSRIGSLSTWTSRGSKGYSPRFTFRPIDLLLDVVEFAAPHAQRTARDELAKIDRSERRGAAFYWTKSALMVPVAKLGEFSVQELRLLGRWVTSVPLATRELGTMPTFALAATVDGEAVAMWWQDSLLFAGLCEDRASIVSLMTRLQAVSR